MLAFVRVFAVRYNLIFLSDTYSMKNKRSGGIVAALCAVSMAAGIFCSFGFAKAEAPAGIVKGCKSAYLMDFDSGECIYKLNERQRMPIASVCKVMTLNLCFDAVEAGKVSLDDEVQISANASGMGGSQVYLECGYSYPLSELIKSIVVCSANDSCVAVAEKISGSEEQFVAEMNRKAEVLGLSDTLFSNCTGLPKETQYSCAADVAAMFAELLKHDEYFAFSKIWLEDFAHGNGKTISMTNTNKLIRCYNGCDGGKTGYTGEAGFCLASTAVRDNMRLVSAVLGGDTSENRFASASSMFDYGFANYKNRIVLDKTVALNEEFSVRGGKKSCYAVLPEENCYIFGKKDEEPDITFEVCDDSVKAPVAKGQKVGTIQVYRDGVLVKSVNVVSAEDVRRASYADRIREVADGWDM